ncbi:MAG TPA: DUF192 domain-containing protein [Candidatus Binataceae bacterium]|nr:DUF192 domain-containing protein [Candidatus Binataceae bacterium]
MTPQFRPARRVIASLALLLSLAVACCARGPEVTLSAPNGTPLATVSVEIADTPSARELGLMYRQHLDENAGMIFLFPDAQRLTFWMKNTVIPLDMIFADTNGRIVGIVENAEPFSERTVGPDADAQYVLEVNGGFARRHHVAVGDLMKFSGFSTATAR